MDWAPTHRAAARHEDAGLRGAYALLGLGVSAFIPFLTLLLRDRGLCPTTSASCSRRSRCRVCSRLRSGATPPTHGSGRSHTLQLACAAASVFALGLIVTGSNLIAVAAVCALLGAAQAPHTALTDALVLSRLGAQRVDEYGAFRLWQSVGWGVGCIAIGALLTAAGVGLALPIYAGGVAVYAVYVARFGRRRPEARPPSGSRLGSVGEAFRTVEHLPMFLLGMLVFATVDARGRRLRAAPDRVGGRRRAIGRRRRRC